MSEEEARQEPAEEEEDLDALWNDARPVRTVQPRPQSSSEDDSDEDSDAESDDSATKRRKAAEARLRDYGEGEDGASEAASRPIGGLLPSAAAAFTGVDGPPAFLDPEATRPLATGVHTGIDRVGTGATAADVEQDRGPKGRKAGWDISMMAPKLKDSSKPAERGVISAAAVTYKPEDKGEAVTAAQIAMLGGQWGRSTGGGADGEEQAGSGMPGAARPPGSEKPDKGKATKPMGVEEFLDKGVGGAQLPRKRQDRKEREKDKRARGQSSHHVWKSEAEMLLRQQYD